MIIGFILDCSAQKVSITGKLEDVPVGTKISLVPGDIHMRLSAVDSAIIRKGTFEINSEISEPRHFYLRTQGIPGQISLLSGPGEEIKVSGTLNSPIITGSPTHNLFIEKYVKPRSKINEEHIEIRDKFSAVSKRMPDARVSKNIAAIAEVESSEEWIAYNKETGEWSKNLMSKWNKLPKKIRILFGVLFLF